MAGRFITQNRIKRSRWEDSLMRGVMKRVHPGKKLAIEHTNCGCGAMSCKAVPTIITRRFDVNYNEVSTEELTPTQAKKTLLKRKRAGNKKLKWTYDPSKDAAQSYRGKSSRPSRTKGNLPIKRIT